jgi:hypothetical protein
MTQADRVHSTPPTNTSLDQTRRGLVLGVAGALSVGAALAGTATARRALAALPATADASSDPIFAVIENSQSGARVSFGPPSTKPIVLSAAV